MGHYQHNGTCNCVAWLSDRPFFWWWCYWLNSLNLQKVSEKNNTPPFNCGCSSWIWILLYRTIQVFFFFFGKKTQGDLVLPEMHLGFFRFWQLATIHRSIHLDFCSVSVIRLYDIKICKIALNEFRSWK